MDPYAFQVLVALRKVNESLLEGLRTCIFILEKKEQLTPESRKWLIVSIKSLIQQGETAFESAQTEN